MATYNKTLLAQDNTRCDAHSEFDSEGFALPLNGEHRAWVPVYGDTCEVCQIPC